MSRHTEYVPLVPDWQKLKHHPLSALVEFGAGIDLDALAADMRENGYDEDKPIILLDGMILDGRHRHKAAIMAEVEPSWRKFTGKDPISYAMEKLRRQHLTESQRAMLAAQLAKLPRGANQHRSIDLSSTPTQAKAAELLNVSERNLKRAKTVLEEGTPTLQAAVSDGTVSVSDAARIVSQPAKVQNRAVKDVQQGKAPTATASATQQDRKLCPSCTRRLRVGQPLPKSCPDCPKKERQPGDDTLPTEPFRPGVTIEAPDNTLKGAVAVLRNRSFASCILTHPQADCVLSEIDSKSAKIKFIKPTIEEIAAYCRERRNKVDAEVFFDFYQSKGWLVGKVPMKDWRAAVRTWEKNNYGKNGTHEANGKRKPMRGEFIEE